MANEITGQQVIVEDGINIRVVSEDGRINLSSNGQGTSRQILSLDRQAVSTLSAVSAGTVSICFPAQLPEGEFPGVKKLLAIDAGWDTVFRPEVVKTATVIVDKVPMFPIDLTTEALDIVVQAWDGTILVASTLEDGTFTGDVDPLVASAYDPTTGRAEVTFDKHLKFEQVVTIRKRFPVTLAPAVEVDVPDLVPFTIERLCHFGLKPTRKPYLAGAPIAPGTVTFNGVDKHGKRVEIKDDGAGALIGDIDVGGVNTVDYKTGEVNMTLAVNIVSVVTGRWGVYQEVTEYQNLTAEEAKVMVRVDIDWQDIHRIVLSMKQSAAAAEQNVKYRVDV